jgi:hypothetical protein
MITQHEAAERAETLLTRQPPLWEKVALAGEPEDQGWCWLCYWTLASNLSGETQEAPPPGTGPILVVKSSGETRYLGSQAMEDELAAAAAELRE